MGESTRPTKSSEAKWTTPSTGRADTTGTTPKRAGNRPPQTTVNSSDVDADADLAQSLRAVIIRNELRNEAPFPRSIAVTPVGPGDDAARVSRALATILADELGDSTCWIDCSWLDATARPSRSPNPVSNDAAVRTPTLAVVESSRLSEATFPAVDPGLGNATVRSAQFANEVAQLDERFDRVVFALPSVLTNPSALAILPQVDGTIFVTTYRATRVHDVERAVVAIKPTPTLAVVVTQFNPSIPRWLRRLHGG